MHTKQKIRVHQHALQCELNAVVEASAILAPAIEELKAACRRQPSSQAFDKPTAPFSKESWVAQGRSSAAA